MMHGHEKSDFAIVAMKPANKAEQPAAEQSAAEPTATEPVERRAETKGNAGQQSTHRTQSWASVSQALERIRQASAVRTRGRSRMRESCMYGSVRGAPSNGRPYRDRFVEGVDRGQTTLFPECLEDWIDEGNPVRVIDAFVEKLDLSGLGFDGVAPEATGRPSYHPSGLLKLYIYGYLNRVQSSRRLEREAGRNVEVMWLTCRLIPDHKTIADFRKDSGPAIKQVCVQFIELCRQMGLPATASIAIDGSKFKAVNTRDKNFTRGKVERRRAKLAKSVAGYLAQLANIAAQAKEVLGVDELEAVADRGYYSGEEILACDKAGIAITLPKPMTSGIEARGRFGKQDFVYLSDEDAYRCPAGEKLKYYYTNEENGQKLRRYWTNACRHCALKQRCTTGVQRRIARWEHEDVLEAVQKRLDKNPQAMRQRRETVEHPFGTLKMRMGATHFLMKRLPKVATEMALHVLAYNLTRVMNIIGVQRLLAAMRACLGSRQGPAFA